MKHYEAHRLPERATPCPIVNVNLSNVAPGSLPWVEWEYYREIHNDQPMFFRYAGWLVHSLASTFSMEDWYESHHLRLMNDGRCHVYNGVAYSFDGHKHGLCYSRR